VIALTRGTVYADSKSPIGDASVLIDGTRIVAVGRKIDIPSAAQVVDCSGLSITAGFWNSHVHLFERKWANAADIPAPELEQQLTSTFTRYGFTSVFDLCSSFENTRTIRDRIERGEVAGPRIRTTGPAIVAPGALPSEDVFRVMGVMRFPAPEAADASQASDAVRKLLDDGVDAIKLFPIVESAMAAAVDEAHRRGKLVFLHPNRGEDVVNAVSAGVDVIAHTTPQSPKPIDTRVALTPTLHIWKSFLRHDRISAQEKTVGAIVNQLREFVTAGGTVLFGTDLGALDPDPAEEYELMRMAGMSFRQILESLTTAPAARFGESHRLGRIAPGLEADLVAFAGEDLADVRYVVQRGNILPV